MANPCVFVFRNKTYTYDGFRELLLKEGVEKILPDYKAPVVTKGGKAEVTTDKKPAEVTEPTKTETLKVKEGEVKQRMAERFGRLSNIKEAVSEGEKPDLFKDLYGLITDAVELGEIKLEQGIEFLKEKLPNLKNFIEQNKDDILPKEISLKHAETEALRQEYGMNERVLRDRKTDAQLEADADAQIKAGYDVNKLADDILAGDKLMNDLDYVVLTKKAALLDKQLRETDPTSPEFDKIFKEQEKTLRASEVSGSEQGAAFRMRGVFKAVAEDSLTDFLLREKDANKGAPLTEGQKQNAVKEFESINKAKDEFAEYVKGKEAELSEREAEIKLKEAQKEARKQQRKTQTARVHEDFVRERQTIKDNILAKLKASRGQTQAAIVPYAKELIAIAPDVGKLVKSYASEGIVKLEEIVKNIHEDLKGFIPEMSEADVRDIIAGKYAEKKATRSETAKQMYDLKQESKATNKLLELQQGKEPVIEKKKIERNQKVEELRKQIKEHDLTKLAEYKGRLKDQINKLQEQLDKDDFGKPEKKKPIILDKEGKELMDKYIRQKLEREVRLMKQEYASRKQYDKVKDMLLEVLNVPRTIMSSGDFSAFLRQGIIAGVAHPMVAGRNFVKMFGDFGSQKHFDRFFYGVKDDPLYPISKESGLYVADPHDIRLTAKEEAFMNNYAEKIPYIGRSAKLPTIKKGKIGLTEKKYGGMVKASERAYVGYLNRLRWDIFKQQAENLENNGMTFENAPEVYKAMANLINNETGRGKMGGLEEAAPILSTTIFAPRLIASRVNMLTNWANPNFYRKVPKPVRVQYFKDMAKFIGAGMTILAIAKASGADVETDPRSSDFGKIKIGNSRWDIWGGHQQYIRMFTQMLLGTTKSAQTGKTRSLGGEDIFGQTRADVLLRFIRGKLAPMPALAADVLAGRNIIGEKVTVTSELQNKLLPLMIGDIEDAYKDGGVKSALGVGMPAIFGVSVQTYGGRDYVQKVMDKRKEPKKELSKEEQAQNKIGRAQDEERMKLQAEQYGIEYVPKSNPKPSKSSGLGSGKLGGTLKGGLKGKKLD